MHGFINCRTVAQRCNRSSNPVLTALGRHPQAHAAAASGRKSLGLRRIQDDTMNFYAHIASTNLRPKLPQRGKNKQGRYDLRQMGLALVVDQMTQLPLAHVLYEGARSDMRTFAEFLKPVQQRLRELTGQPEQLTLVFDA